MIFKHVIWLSAGAASLLLAIGLQLVRRPSVLPGKGPHLAKTIPADVPGWESRPIELGPNEAANGDVEKILRFDDVQFRGYFRGPTLGFAIYVAYWTPGKMPTQLVASHTPDRCWPEAGWRCTEARHEIRLAAEEIKLRPGQERLFENQAGSVQHVIFWHLVGDELYDYGDRLNTAPNVWKWWRDVARQATTAPREQYFVRLTSEQSFADLQRDAGFRELLRHLAALGLAER